MAEIHLTQGCLSTLSPSDPPVLNIGQPCFTSEYFQERKLYIFFKNLSTIISIFTIFDNNSCQNLQYFVGSVYYLQNWQTFLSQLHFFWVLSMIPRLSFWEDVIGGFHKKSLIFFSFMWTPMSKTSVNTWCRNDKLASLLWVSQTKSPRAGSHQDYLLEDIQHHQYTKERCILKRQL